MEEKDVKNELIKRYKYFHENAPLILGPFYSNYDLNIPSNVINNLEIALLSDTKLEDTFFYKYFEKQIEDKEYLEKAKNAIEKQKKDSWGYSFPSDLGIWNLLAAVRKHVKDQSGDLKNKKIKLEVLDEYFRLKRYRNNGQIWTSGYEERFEDLINNCAYVSAIPIRKDIKPTRQIWDVGVKNNIFLNTINYREDKKYVSYFSEEEKQDVYLSLNDELPWNLKINCSFEDSEEDALERPENTVPCKEDFTINESKIFKNKEEYYQRCSNCGYIVVIPKELFSPGIKSRIDERAENNSDLLRQNVLESELQGIKNKRKVLTK